MRGKDDTTPPNAFQIYWKEALERKSKKARPPKEKKNPESNRKAKKEFVRPDYYQYIKSAAWRAKKKAAFEYHGSKCQTCGSTINLHVHHKTYANLGREKMKDLEIACEGCHANIHEGQVFGVKDPMTKEFAGIMR